MQNAYTVFMSDENERFTEPLQVRITPVMDMQINEAARAAEMKRPELVRQALRRGIPLLLNALGVSSLHGAEHLPGDDIQPA
jgi:hypothetical protein